MKSRCVATALDVLLCAPPPRAAVHADAAARLQRRRSAAHRAATVRGRRRRARDPGNAVAAEPAGDRTRPAPVLRSRGCRSTARCRARPATQPLLAFADARQALAGGGRRSTATRRRCGTRSTSAGTAGTARPTASGRRRSGRSCTRTRWTRTPRMCATRSSRDDRTSRAAIEGVRPAGRQAMRRPCWSTPARRSVPSSARWCRAARRSTHSATRSRVATGARRRATRSPRSAACGCSSAAATATSATSGPMFSNGEFGDTGLPFFVRPGVVDPGRHKGIELLRRANTTCCRAGAMRATMRRPRPRRGR